MSPKVSRILVINPNTSTAITETFKPIISKLNLPNISFSYWTSILGPPIIQTQDDLNKSALLCLQPLIDTSSDYDGFLIACYAEHPLTAMLQATVGNKPVIGIFGASISAALSLNRPNSKFGIITTGEFWTDPLAVGVRRYLGAGEVTPEIFGGVIASGVGASDLSAASRDIARAKVIQATMDLVRGGDVSVICPGGAILIGMEDWIREGCQLELGGEKGSAVLIVDQLLVGVMALYGLLQFQF